MVHKPAPDRSHVWPLEKVVDKVPPSYKELSTFATVVAAWGLIALLPRLKAPYLVNGSAWMEWKWFKGPFPPPSPGAVLMAASTYRHASLHALGTSYPLARLHAIAADRQSRSVKSAIKRTPGWLSCATRLASRAGETVATHKQDCIRSRGCSWSAGTRTQTGPTPHGARPER